MQHIFFHSLDVFRRCALLVLQGELKIHVHLQWLKLNCAEKLTQNPTCAIADIFHVLPPVPLLMTSSLLGA